MHTHRHATGTGGHVVSPEGALSALVEPPLIVERQWTGRDHYAALKNFVNPRVDGRGHGILFILILEKLNHCTVIGLIETANPGSRVERLQKHFHPAAGRLDIVDPISNVRHFSNGSRDGTIGLKTQPFDTIRVLCEVRYPDTSGRHEAGSRFLLGGYDTNMLELHRSARSRMAFFVV
jgi:hypothetical protein